MAQIYKPNEAVYFVRSMIYAGQKRKAGERVPEKFLGDINHVDKMLRNRLFGQLSSGIRLATVDGKPTVNQPVEDQTPSIKAEELAEASKEKTEEKEDDKAEVVVDTDESFQVAYKGLQFEVARNQVREDGSLTAGGLKAYKKAKAAS